jgi:hypothetical protein
MLGPPKARHVDRPVLASLETLVPPHNFYRHLEATLDLSFVRALVRDRYAATGRPSLDPSCSSDSSSSCSLRASVRSESW